MKRWLLMVFIVSLLLSGCSGIQNGHYHSVEPHEVQNNQTNTQNISVENYEQLCQSLTELVAQGDRKSVV